MKKIDSYAIDVNKALIFTIVSIVITVISIALFIVPTMEQFKVSKITNRHATKRFLDTKQYYEQRLEELQVLKSRNKKAIEALHKGFIEEDLQKYMNNYLSNISLSATDLENRGAYFYSRDINISGEFPSPEKFFESVKNLNAYGNLINIEFPIVMQSKEGHNLTISFPLRTYTLKDLNGTFNLQ